uniref:Putative secreted protein n=1 Tax=Anopheles darlingi TaxID=43151 RepID=A0A2M4D7Z1_ANODA
MIVMFVKIVLWECSCIPSTSFAFVIRIKAVNPRKTSATLADKILFFHKVISKELSHARAKYSRLMAFENTLLYIELVLL